MMMQAPIVQLQPQLTVHSHKALANVPLDAAWSCVMHLNFPPLVGF